MNKNRKIMDTIIKAYEKLMHGSMILEEEDAFITIEDKIRGVISIKPKDETKLNDMYMKTLEKLKKRGVIRWVACYKKDGKIFMERVNV